MLFSLSKAKQIFILLSISTLSAFAAEAGTAKFGCIEVSGFSSVENGKSFDLEVDIAKKTAIVSKVNSVAYGVLTIEQMKDDPMFSLASGQVRYPMPGGAYPFTMTLPSNFTGTKFYTDIKFSVKARFLCQQK